MFTCSLPLWWYFLNVYVFRRLSRRMIVGQVRVTMLWPVACLLHNLRACLYGNPVGFRYYPDLPRGGAPTLEEYLTDIVAPPEDEEDVGGQEEVDILDLLDL